MIETESYGAENIRDTKRFYQYWEGMYIRDMRVRVSFQKKDYKKREIGDTITMTRFIWK